MRTATPRNAAEGRAEIDALTAELASMLEPRAGQPFIVFHDAYHYFERRFRIAAAGAISLGDASAPEPRRASPRSARQCARPARAASSPSRSSRPI